jgi:hypothetical protein
MYGGYSCFRSALIVLCLALPIWGSQSVFSPPDDVPIERREFRQLLANNPHYFDKPHAFNDPTTYEQLICIGYNANRNLLEATIEIKLKNGFGGGLCTNGSTEYVAFYVDYGSGWNAIGNATLNTHNIHNRRDCKEHREKPLFYSVSIGFQPVQDDCTNPILPKIRAILSWEKPPDSPFYIPVWGNVLDQHVQVPPGHPPDLSHDPTSREHRGRADTKTDTKNCRDRDLSPKNVEPSDPARNAKEDISLRPPGSNVFFEELIGLGLDYDSDRLVATVRIKQELGYGRELCFHGGFEYVSFWADWNDTCDWTYLGTRRIHVHDIPDIPHDGLTYSAILPVNLEYERAFCNKTKIARIQAAVAFESNPPLPPDSADRGNFLIKHVQLRPYIHPNNTGIDIIGGVEVKNIDWTGSGQTTSGATFYDFPYSPTDALNLGRSSPFGGNIVVNGPLIGTPGEYSYRLLARQAGSLGDGTAVTNPIRYAGSPDTPVFPSTNGYFPYVFDLTTNPQQWSISYWTPTINGLWQIRLETATTDSYTLVNYTDWYNVLVNNIRPTGDIFPTSGSTCGDFIVGTNITGDFLANAQYMSFWGIVVPEGFELSYTDDPPPSFLRNAPVSQWTLSTVNATPCGYTVDLEVEDLTVLDSTWDPRMAIWTSFSFCLLGKTSS